MKYPYQNTTITPEQTQEKLRALLKKHGINQVYYSPYGHPNCVEFSHYMNNHDQLKQVSFKLRVPVLPREASAWRLVYWYIQLKLRAIDAKLATYEQEFLAHVALSLKDGRRIPFGELAEQLIRNGSLDRLALTEK